MAMQIPIGTAHMVQSRLYVSQVLLMYLALDICCLSLLVWSIGGFPGSTGPKRLALKDKMFQQREKLLQLTPEQQEGLYLLLVILLIRSMFLVKHHSQLFQVEARLSTSDFHLVTALIYFSCEYFSIPKSLPYTSFCRTLYISSSLS